MLVSASNNSHTSFKIKKGRTKSFFPQKINKDLQIGTNIEDIENKKRGFSNHEETIKCQRQMTGKKIKFQKMKDQGKKCTENLNLISSLLGLLRQQNTEQFCFQFQKSTQINDHHLIKNQITFPNKQLPELNESRNQLLTRNIEIMSNKNQKISIPIHEGLYKSNTSHKTDNMEQDGQFIPNLCDFRMKNQYSESIQFIRDYKSGYTPIQMQKTNNQEIQDDKRETLESGSKTQKDKSRSHFIRKQQSTLSLPRTCGVSYIKPSESLQTQKPPFEPLPPLIFQGSTSCFIGSNQQVAFSFNSLEKQRIEKFILSLQNAWLPFIFSEEDEMRDLLLSKKTKKAKVGFVQGIQNLWPLFFEGCFILILISTEKMTTQSQVWEAFQNKLNYFKIGILSKKSTSGKKAFLKSIKSQRSDSFSIASFDTHHNEIKNDPLNPKIKEQKYPAYQSITLIDNKDSLQESKKNFTTFDLLEEELKDCRTVITMGIRLQMYVEETDWKDILTKQNKQMLNEIIMNFKEKLQKKSIKIITERLQLANSTNFNFFDQKLQYLRVGVICSKEKSLMDKRFNICNESKENQNLILKLLESKEGNNLQFSFQQKKLLLQNTVACSPSYFLSRVCTEQSWKKTLKFPLYYISTRDSFAFDLIEKKTVLKRSNGRQYTRIDYYFYPDNLPTNFSSEYKRLFPKLDVGATAYHGFFTEQQLKQFEGNTFQMQKTAFRNKFSQMTVQPSIVSTKIKRTKFFFGYRYMWTRCQLSEPCSYVGAGVRKDVASPPNWTKSISDKMVQQKIVEKDFINSIAVNVYHDGKEGLAQHFDDAVRFKQPIYTLRLFSDARLSFGSQFYGFCNGAFIIPLPRGCILVMEENSYAANGVKHCVRPCDMTGKSAAVIMRQMHSKVVSQASKYDQFVDFPAWISCLSENQNSITFAEQKRLQAQQIMKTKID